MEIEKLACHKRTATLSTIALTIALAVSMNIININMQ